MRLHAKCRVRLTGECRSRRQRRRCADPLLTGVGSCSFWLDNSARDALQALGKRSGATFFNVLLATFGVLLNKYTAQEDFLLATPVIRAILQQVTSRKVLAQRRTA